MYNWSCCGIHFYFCSFLNVLCFGEPAVWSNLRGPIDRKGVSRVIYLTLVVMYSHYPWDSTGFLLSFILTLLTITVTPSLFLSIYPPVSLFPPPSQLPWRFIVALTERPLPSPSECWEGCISRISDSAVSFLQWTQIQCFGRCVSNACISVWRLRDRKPASLLPSPVLYMSILEIRHLSVAKLICLHTRQHVN